MLRCATSTRGLRERFAARHPTATMYADFEELLADESIDGVVIATPVPTHYALAKRALEAGKHALVEKPPAMRASEMEELVALARDDNACSCRATSCSTTPASRSSSS